MLCVLCFESSTLRLARNCTKHGPAAESSQESQTMAGSQPPKVLLFDIGGVCVVSPFQAILDYEHANGIPPGYINYSISRKAPGGWWHRLERGEVPVDDVYFRGFKSDLEDQKLWEEYYRRVQSLDKEQTLASEDIPPLPSFDGEKLFITMMTISRTPDRFMWPALKKLKASGKFRMAALSNNVTFPPGHFLNEVDPKEDVRGIFELFIGSATVGMRKPDREIYDYTMQRLRNEWGDDLQPGDVLFLDDIGQNLKMARTVGWRTIKVILGQTADAVRELEKVTGLELLDDRSAHRARL